MPRTTGGSMPRISLIVLLALVATTVSGCNACTLWQAVRGPSFFSEFRPVGPTVIPPVRGLELWVEGETLPSTTSTVVMSWPDMRGQSQGQVRAWTRNDGTLMSGTVIAGPLRNPAGTNRVVRALRCVSTPRCSYVLADSAGAPRLNVLTGRPYAIFAVVTRSSNRGDQYVVMTEGVGCDPLTGISCTANTALHLGWSGERTLRLPPYGQETPLGP